MRKLVLTLALFLATSASATTWHVRSTAACANNGNGTASTCAASAGAAGAWSGLANIGWASISAGDSILLYGGDTYTDVLTVGKSGTGSGTTFTSPITISVENTSSGTNPAIVDINNAVSTAFINNGKAYIVYDFLYGQDAVADPSGTPNANYGLKVINIGSNGNCLAENGAGGPIKVYHLDCSGNSTGGDDTHGGIIIYGSGPGGNDIAYNWIHGTYTGATQGSRWHANAVMVFTGEAASGYGINKIHHNKAEYLYHDGFKATNNTSMYNNEATHVEGSSHSDSHLCQSTSYCEVYNNYIHNDGDQAIYLDMVGSGGTYAHMRVYNNLVVSSSFCVVIHPEDNDMTDVVVANNTCAGPNDNSTIRKGGCGGIGGCHFIYQLAVLNNIVGTSAQSAKQIDYNSGDVTFVDANAFDYDVYLTPSSAGSQIVNSAPGCPGGCTLTQLRALSPARETNGKVANPTFVNSSSDWHLTSGDTVAKGAGRNLYSTYTFLQTDKDGAARSVGAAWDIGAYSYPASAANAPTFSPGAGTYSTTQSVTPSTTSGGAIICYTTNGTTPATNGISGCNAGTLFSTAISVSTTLTVKAVAGGTSYSDSSVASAAYIITNTAPPRPALQILIAGAGK